MQKIQWMEWSAKAFERAKKENKPVLLDIGTHWCHWCRVMDITTYRDPEVVEIVSQRFIPIRVDADSRPDINSRYNRGGWPTTAFLTPEGDLIGGSTYIPAAQMKRTAMEYSNFYEQQAETVLQKGREVRRKAAEMIEGKTEIEEAAIDEQIVRQAIQQIKENADTGEGGFGKAPKFPHPEPVELALLWYQTHHDIEMLDFARRTLDAMMNGGIHDHIGGGFHRYAVTANWHVPHFEKLLNVNASLLSAYCKAYHVADDERYRQTAEGIINFMFETLSAEGGVFYAGQDADAFEGDDGSYFTWTLSEIRDSLPESLARVVVPYFGITPEGDIEVTPERNVLHVTMATDELEQRLKLAPGEARTIISKAEKILLDARNRRMPPKLDTKIITDWNCLAAEALFDAYETFGNENYRKRALAVVNFLMERALSSDWGTYHFLQDGHPSVHGLLTDIAAMQNACLRAYEATGKRLYLDCAEGMVTYMRTHLTSPSDGYYDSPHRTDDFGELSVKDRSVYENAAVARALAKLYMLTGKISYEEDARLTLAALLPEYSKFTYLAAEYAIAVDFLVNYPTEFVTVGSSKSSDARALHECSLHLLASRKIVQFLDPQSDADLLAAKGIIPPAKPTTFMCVHANCAPPVHTPEELLEAYEHFLTVTPLPA